jgi:hypothetical protein
MLVNIARMNLKKMEDNAVVVAIGRRRSGKTTLITELLYHKRHFEQGVVMSGTNAGAEHYSQFVPNLFVYEGYHGDVIKRLVDKQEQARREKTCRPLFILLEDCMFDKKTICHDKNIRRIFMNGRHAKIMLIITMQYVMDLPPGLRGQVDYVFCCNEKNPVSREKIYRNFNPCFSKFEDFDKVMVNCTRNRDVMVLNQNGATSAVEDNVFYCRAVPDRQFQIGTFWWHYVRKKRAKRNEKIEENKCVRLQ